jgi:hypothetical protein
MGRIDQEEEQETKTKGMQIHEEKKNGRQTKRRICAIES